MPAKDNSRDYGLSADELHDKYPGPNDTWGEHPHYTREDWKQEVGDDNTLLGYWAWVEHELEIEEEDANNGDL